MKGGAAKGKPFARLCGLTEFYEPGNLQIKGKCHRGCGGSQARSRAPVSKLAFNPIAT